MKPIQTLLFLFSVGMLSAATAWFFPKDGIVIFNDYKLKFASFEQDTSNAEPIKKIEDIEAFLDELTIEIDSTAIKDSIHQAEIIYRQKMLRIQWPDSTHGDIAGLFKALDKVKSGKKRKLRVMHYGDSQIEGDRITGIIRNQLQKEYGGIGPGLVPVVEAVPNAAILQSNSDNWNRFTLYGRVDTNVTHRRYGPLFSMGMFTYPTDTLNTETKTAWVQFETSKMTYFKTRKYSQASLYYGHVEKSFIAQAYVNDVLMKTDIVTPKEGYSTMKWTFETTPEKFKVEFIGNESPEFYAFSFEGNSGVTVDNIGSRGSSGTLFKKVDGAQLAGFMQSQPVELFILQFGGNTVPYIKSEDKAVGYGNWFKSQIRYLKKINPNAVFIVIGPSDMATKIDGEFQTYPYLESVRDALKKAAFESGAGYWDLYEVMGGKNSMISWVEAEKPLAGADYVHFNNLGTRKVSELFMTAFWHEKERLEAPEVPSQHPQTDSTDVKNQ